jgi:hypothetical protein
LAKLPTQAKVCFREGFRMPADVTDGSGIGPASESLRRTNPREAASGLPIMGILSGSGFGEARFWP